MQRKIFLSLAVTALILSMLACSSSGSGTPTPESGTPKPGSTTPVTAVSETPPQGQINLDDLTISGLNGFIGDFGYYYVVCLLTNHSSLAATDLQLAIQMTDASGAPILIYDYTGNEVPVALIPPLLDTLAPGETAPFSFYSDLSGMAPAAYQVTVSGASVGTTARAALQTEHIQIVHDGQYYEYVAGELVNPGDSWVEIKSMAVTLLDAEGKILAADHSYSAHYLAPAGDPQGRDRTPFISTPYITPTSASTISNYQFWLDADAISEVTDYPLTIEVTNSYFDMYNMFHIVGTVTNSYDQALETALMAGAYAQDGTVLDTGSADLLEIPIPAGGTAPFDATNFSALETIPSLRPQLATISVQVDEGYTRLPPLPTVELTGSGETLQFAAGTATLTGNYTNSSNQDVWCITVVAALYDAGGKLAATRTRYFHPSLEGGRLAPGGTGSYEIYLLPDPEVSTSGWQAEVRVIGNVY